MQPSKQRVVDALNHREPDRVPLDLGSTCVTGISRKTLVKFMDYVNLPKEDVEISDLFQQLGRPRRVFSNGLTLMSGLLTRSPRRHGTQHREAQRQ